MMTAPTTQSADTAGSTGSTGSMATKILGLASLAGMAVLLVFAFLFTEADLVQEDAVRLIYLHVPIALISYAGFIICAVGSVMVLWKRSTWWDIAAAAGAELGVLFCGLTLVTGVIWGRPIWNTWWEWGDVRLMTSLMLFLVYVGYLAYRRSVTTAEVRARRSAIIGIVGVLNIPIVNRSVEWWESRTLHQKSTLGELKIEDLTLFTLMLGMVVFALVFTWLLVHRFRIGWLEYQHETVGLQAALAERRAQSAADVDDAVAHPGLSRGAGR